MSVHLVYFADPMCSWCWGFSPVIDAVKERFPVKLIVGGLRPGITEALDEASKRAIREHWEHVHKASGQPFDFSFFEQEGFVYDTEPPSRALVAVRRLRSELTFPFLKIVHRAFYAENKDVTDPEVLCALAVEAGVDGRSFANEFGAKETALETRQDFAITHHAGITGFPTLLAGSDTAGYEIITHGYQPWNKIEAVIEARTGGLERTG